eukprot:TRINITY_DN25647_c0_g1_i1.p1 TRINITY_DN25647_c0_g1~~TRINITY_DN25647_c0_g1_i1.p1  ORF type:complete len:286 (+),score=45.04 TRINITY_DN25647_c0_g1_i1:93-860(+)
MSSSPTRRTATLCSPVVRGTPVLQTPFDSGGGSRFGLPRPQSQASAFYVSCSSGVGRPAEESGLDVSRGSFGTAMDHGGNSSPRVDTPRASCMPVLREPAGWRGALWRSADEWQADAVSGRCMQEHWLPVAFCSTFAILVGLGASGVWHGGPLVAVFEVLFTFCGFAVVIISFALGGSDLQGDEEGGVGGLIEHLEMLMLALANALFCGAAAALAEPTAVSCAALTVWNVGLLLGLPAVVLCRRRMRYSRLDYPP